MVVKYRQIIPVWFSQVNWIGQVLGLGNPLLSHRKDSLSTPRQILPLRIFYKED